MATLGPPPTRALCLRRSHCVHVRGQRECGFTQIISNNNMDAGRYRLFITVQMLLLIVDILTNSFSEIHTTIVTQLILSVIQAVSLVFNIIVMFLVFFNTYAFQAGLVNVLLRHFSFTILTSLVYLSLTIGLNVWSLRLKWSDPYHYIWTTGLFVLYVLQRSCSVLYYYFYKNTALQLSRKCYYEDCSWLRGQLSGS